jgi:outer membrane protein insertion porin family
MRGALRFFLLVCLASVWLLAVPAGAQGPRIEDIRWEGLRRIPRDTMNARIISKKGDPYNPNALRRDFRAVWNTNFFETVRLEVDDGEDNPTDKILYFIVQERPLIRRIDYDGVKSLQQSDILEGFRLSRVGLSVEMQYDPTRVRRAEVVLTQHRRPLPAKTGFDGLQRSQRRGQPAEDRKHDPGRSQTGLQPRVPQPPG